MPYFDDFFKQSLEELDRRKESDSRISEALQKYEGRSLHLSVRGDASYLFSISTGKVTYLVNPEHVPDDIYVEMDLPRAKRLIEKRTFSPFDLFFVKYRNVKPEDIELVRTLFQS